ncbi:MAG: hypothetical protein WCK77_00545 [Verrucomicrobiota bacterium]
MNSNDSPRILIQSPNARDEILLTERGDGSWQPNTWLNDDLRQAIENLPDRALFKFLDPASNEFRYLSRSKFADQLATALHEFLISCENHEFDLIRTLGRDPAIFVSEDLAEKLGIQIGRRLVSVFLGELGAIQQKDDTE